jgi:hypothetical protein
VDNEFNVSLANLKVGTDVVIEKLDINLKFKCEPEVAAKWMELVSAAIEKISAAA